jgi:transcriptional regulator with XRE-family HTH domain
MAGKRPTLQELADQVGLSKSTLAKYAREGWDRDPATLDDFRKQHRTKPVGTESLTPRMDRRAPDEPDDDDSRRNWSDEYRRVRTLQAVVELKARQGELIRRDEVERLFVMRVAEVRAGLLLLPRQLARRLAHQDAATIEADLEAEVLALLERYSRGDTVLDGKARKRGKGRRA